MAADRAHVPHAEPDLSSAQLLVPTRDAVRRRLQQILARGSNNLGAKADTERLMLMLTRSCELRCSYCFVQKVEDGVEMSQDTARRAIDLFMRSERRTLEVQFFGGEPTRRWDVLVDALGYASAHPGLRGRELRFVLTTNGAGLDAERIALLGQYPVMVLFSLDGDASAHRRFRAAHLTSDEDAWEAISNTISLLKASEVAWFMNATLPASAGHEVYDRYLWARKMGVPKLQLNYAIGMHWSQEQETAYLLGLQRALRDHHARPSDMMLFNWRSDCEPVMLSDDLIVDVDGSLRHDGSVFLERAFGQLRTTYARGHVDTQDAFDPLRLSLAELDRIMRASFAPGTPQHRAVVQNIEMGAAVDLVIQWQRRKLGV